jgi:large subunit ribosomal protein L25
MSDMKLGARVRTKEPKSVMDKERKNGSIAAVMYGHGKEATALWVERLAFEKLYAVAGESTIIELTIDGKKKNVLVQDVDVSPLGHRYIHVDFLEVQMNEALEAHIPMEFVGESAAIRELGGMLVKTLEEVEVSCLPKDLPQHLEVNLAALKDFDTKLTVADIIVPAGVTILTDAATVVAVAEEPRSAEALAALDEKVEVDVTKVEGVVKPESDNK